jgi:hypothetical protein
VIKGMACGISVLMLALGTAPISPRTAMAATLEVSAHESAAPSTHSTTAQDADDTPAFHSELPKGALPPAMEPSSFPDVLVQNAYALAAKVRRLLYQQPCYCRCDKHEGHGSLLDCFAGTHASICETCIREGLYTYEQSRKGKTAAQIRDGIEHGEWKNVDLTKYQSPIASGAAR